jgi:hypothetical protein
MQKVEFIDGASVFRNYEPAWRLLGDLSESLTDQSFKEHTSPIRLIDRDSLIYALEECLELGRCVGGDDFDMHHVKGLIERVKLLNPETLVDIEGISADLRE